MLIPSVSDAQPSPANPDPIGYGAQSRWYGADFGPVLPPVVVREPAAAESEVAVAIREVQALRRLRDEKQRQNDERKVDDGGLLARELGEIETRLRQLEDKLNALLAKPTVRGHKPLILIKARVIEVERNNGLAVGSALEYVSRMNVEQSLTSGLPLNAEGMVGFQNVRGLSRYVVPGLISSSGGSGTGLLVNLTSEHINYVASFLGTELNADVITAPQVTTMHGEEVEFIAGAEVPFEVGFNSIQQNTNNVQQFSYSNVGTRIRVTPRIVEFDSIDRSVPDNTCGWNPENCTVDLDILVQLSDADLDTETDLLFKNNVRNIKNTVQVANHHGAVIGGLISARDVEIVSKTPVLGDVPFLGFLFRSKRNERSKSETLIFVEAHVLPDVSVMAKAETAHDFQLGQVHLQDDLRCSPLLRGMHNAGLQGEYLPPPSCEEMDYWRCYQKTRKHENRHRIATELRDALK